MNPQIAKRIRSKILALARDPQAPNNDLKKLTGGSRRHSGGARVLEESRRDLSDTVVAAILEGTHPIKAMREYRGMTQVELAQAGGTSSVYISQIERGKRRSGRRLLAKLGQALGVPSDLLERDYD